MNNDIGTDKTEKSKTVSRLIAEQLFEAFRTVTPFRHRPGFGHMQRPGEFQLIHRLSHLPTDSGARVGDLALWLGVRPPTVSQLVDALVSRGLVERFADEDDRRAIRVRLSAEGKAMAQSFHERAIGEVEAIVDHLGEEDSARLAELLLKASKFIVSRHGARNSEHCPGGCPDDSKERGDE
jgi:DNA-binding MarR family transcriptional regulator